MSWCAASGSTRKTGGALLGDRIRMNAIAGGRVFMRSLATRGAEAEISKSLPDVIAACKVAGFDLVLVETSGIGQGDAAIVPLVDTSLYVMTPEYGAASQLEKIDMLDFADFVAINKFGRKGGQDALRDVRKQYQRILPALVEHGLKIKPGTLPPIKARASSARNAIVPPARGRYLAEVADTVRGYHARACEQSGIARERQQLLASKSMLSAAGKDV